MARNPSKAAGALFLPDCHNHSVLLSICPSFSLLACLPICFFDLSLTLSHIHTHTPMYIQGRLEHSVRAGDEREEGAVSMPMELCEWGSDEREAHLVN